MYEDKEQQEKIVQITSITINKKSTDLQWKLIDKSSIPEERIIALNNEYGSMLVGELVNTASGIMCIDIYSEAVKIYATHYIPITELLKLPKE